MPAQIALAWIIGSAGYRLPPAVPLPLIGGTTAGPAGGSEIKLQRLPAFT
jgi:hypothetical protein